MGVKEQLGSNGSAADSAAGVFRDLDELNHAVSGANLEIIQLDPGDLKVRVLNIDIGELSVDRGSVNRKLRVRGGLDAARYGVGLFHPGARARLNGFSVNPSAALFYTPGMELDGHIQEGYGWTSLIIPTPWIESISLAARDSGFLIAKVGCKSMSPQPEKIHDLLAATEAIITSALHPVLSGEGAIPLSLDVRNALGALLSDLDMPTCKTDGRTLSHYRTAQHAERYMRERVSEDLCIDDVCAEIGVSRRFLEYAFVNAFGTSPSRYFRVLRLHQVRRRLRNSDAATTVTHEALSHGFNHLGLFSMQYRTLFGESPSTTLHG